MATTKALELAQLADNIIVNANGEITSIDTISSLDVTGDISTSTLSATTSATAPFFNANTIATGYQLNGTTVLNYSGGNVVLGDLGAGVILHYSGSNKLATTNTGISVTGDAVISGDLTVNGNTVTLNTSSLTVDDLLITVADGAPDAASANGAGIEVTGGLGAKITYDNTGPYWRSSLDFIAEGNITATQVGNSSTALITIDTDANAHGMLRFQEAGTDLWRFVKEPTDELAIDAGAGDIKAVFYQNGDIGFNDSANAEKFLWDASASLLKLENSSNTAYDSTDWDESTAALQILNSDSTSGTGSFLLLSHVANSTGKAAIGVVQGSTSRDGELVFLTRNGAATGDPITEAVRITGAGKVGIGTDNPGAELDLRGNMRLDGSAGTDRSIYFRNQGTVGGQVQSDKNLSLWAGNGSGSATQYLTVKEGGNVGIGTDNPDALLHISATSPHIDIGPVGGNRGKIGYHDLDVIIGSTSSTGDIIFKNNIGSTDAPQTSGDMKVKIADVGMTIYSDTYNILDIATDTNDDQTSTDGILKITNGASHTTKAEFRWDESEDLVHVSYGDHGRHISVNSLGNVGIGTGSSNPVNKLHVDSSGGNSSWTNTLYRGIHVSDDIGGRLILEDTGGDTDAKTFVMVSENGEFRIHSATDDGTGWVQSKAFMIKHATAALHGSHVRHSIRPTLNLDFANSKQLDPRITFYRDSIATYYDENLVLRYAAYNEPRFDHDRETGESKGLLFEEERTNYVTDSGNDTSSRVDPRNFDTNVDNVLQLKRSTEKAPDGTYSALTMNKFANGYGYARYYYPSNSSDARTHSVFVKRGTNRYVGIRISIGGSTHNVWDFDTESWVYTRTGDTTDFEKHPNGWYRLSVYNTGDTPWFSIAVVESSGPEQNNAIGTVHIWGMQREQGAFASTFMPTDVRFLSRSSRATYYDKDGVVRTAPADTPRYGYEYDGRKWIETGLILEASSTNLLYDSTRSTDIYGDRLSAESKWTITDSSTDVVAPDGSQYTTKGVTSDSGNHFFWDTGHPVTYVNGAYYTHSCWIRSATGTGDRNISITCYPQNAVQQTSGSGFLTVTAKEEWTRVSITFKYENTLSKPYVGFVNPTNNSTYYFWGWQVEQSKAPTSYISVPPGSSAGVRAADVASYLETTRERDYALGYDVDSLMDVNKDNIDFTLYGDIQGIAHNTGFQQAIYLEDTSDSGNMYVTLFSAYGGNNTIASSYNINSVARNFGNWTSTESDISLRWKIAMGIEENNSRAAANGVLGSSAAGYWNGGGTFNRFYLGNGYQGGRYFNGHIRKISYYPERLSNEELIALTEND